MSKSFHIEYSEPLTPRWPRGGWVVYKITGDEIASRIVRETIVKPALGAAYYSGGVIARYSWCGYIGMFETLEEATAAIKALE